MTFKKSRNVSKALVIKEKDNENDKAKGDKRAVNQKRLMAMKRALRCGYGCGGGGCGGNGYRLRNRWQPIANMLVNRWSHGLSKNLDQDGRNPTGGVINNKLYVVGGVGGGGSDPENSVLGSGFVRKSGEMYDPRTNRWQPIADMSVKRQYATSGVVCGRLVVVGGTPDGGISSLSSGEMYY